MPRLQTGDFAPDFQVPSSIHPAFRFETTGGRRIVLSFLGSLQLPAFRSVLAELARARDWFAAHRTFVFPVSCDKADAGDAELLQLASPYTVFWDVELRLAALYGLLEPSPEGARLVTGSYLLDENRRVLAFVPAADPAQHAQAVLSLLASLPADAPSRIVHRQAPVLVVPDVLSSEHCAALIRGYEAAGGVDSGYMTDQDGRTVGIYDYYHKRRSDWFITDPVLQQALAAAIASRVAPEIKKAFHFSATRLERFLIARYDSATQDHFRPHRDDNAEATAHRRFALTINLNAGEYEGGDLRFPEYGRDLYSAETGGAVVFSCSLMHEVLPVTTGRRYAFLPFLYDEAAQVLWEAYQARHGTAAAEDGSGKAE